MKKSLTVLILLLFGSFIVPTMLSAQFYTGTQQDFGKNRVQYRDFNWLYYPYKNFEVYFYQGGKDLAGYTVQAAENHMSELETLLDYKMDEQIEIVVYNKMSEFRQSNIGITGDSDSNIGGSTRIVGSKVFLYFSGDYISYNQQIRAALAEVIISKLLYGGDWKQVVKNNTLLQLPDWYLQGLIEYAEGGFSPERTAFIQDGIMSGKYDNFNWLEGKDAVYGGYALWEYVSDVYGENVIPNIMYMTKISRNIESGFLYVLGVSLSTLMENFKDYHYRNFSSDQLVRQMPDWDPISNSDEGVERNKKWMKRLGELPIKSKKHLQYYGFKMSPDQENIAYVTNELGQVKVWMYNRISGKKKRIFKHGYPLQRITDESFPVLAWHPTGLILSFVYEKQGRAFMVNYNLEDKKLAEKELFRIDKVIDMDYSKDGRKIIFSGVKEGQSDLYMYQTIGNNQTQLTNDIFDDLNPQFIRESEAIIFASNRPDDTLRTDTENSTFPLEKDIFILDLNSGSRVLERVTSTPEVDEIKPFEYDQKRYTYLAQRENKLNRYVARIDSAISRIDTIVHYRFFTVSNQVSNYERIPLEYDFQENSGDYGLVFYENGTYNWYLDNKKTDRILGPGNSAENDGSPGIDQGVDVLIIEPEPLKEGQIDIKDYQFEDDTRNYEFEKETISLDTFDSQQKGDSLTVDSAVTTFELPKPRNYRLNFATDYILSQVDNQFNSQTYQRNNGPTSTFPGISGFVKLGISDLFEDYKIVGGFRLAVSLDNSDLALSFEDLSKRIDRKFMLQRQGNRMVSDNGFGISETQTYSAEYQYKYPFTELASVRLSATYRMDRRVTLATDVLNLGVPNQLNHNVGLKVQYVYDNTISRGLNLYNGTRLKFWAEYFRNPLGDQEDTKVLGADIRHYKRIHRDLILAVRLAGHTSFGSRKIISYLGGVDNWLFQKVDEQTNVPSGSEYFYQALGSPVRGFFVNARNGNSFAVSNAEIRWPVFKYFMKKPIRSDFIQNFQVVGFGDVGSAWTGLNPYSDENLFNREITEQNPITVTIDSNREPIIWGYGFGLRSRVLGYFVRADWAWGIDDGRVLPRVFHLSLSTDF